MVEIITSETFSAIMANPRKFSEKIALLAQKQAEGTAAFEAILQEVNSATRDPPPPQTAPYSQKQQITPNLGTYRGGSLPNVNQMATNQSIDLQATLQHLDDMKQGRTGIDRPHPRQERHRQTVGPHRRNFPPDKRIDSSPYGSAYHLSPPPDTSWRSCGLPKTHRYLYNGLSLSRVHSDPSLHMNAMDNSKNYSHPPVTPPSHRRIVEMVGETAGNNLHLNYWDSKKIPGPSRPKSCEVPNINIYPSQEQESLAQSQSIPMTANNTGSLPDLSVLQFPSPLPTPLDSEDQYSGANQGSSPVSLSPTSPHHMVMPHQSPQSPSQRRRQVPGGVSIPSPLIINQMGGPPSPAAEMDPRMRQQYLLCLQQQQQQQSQQQHHPHHPPHQQQQQPNQMRQGGPQSPLGIYSQPPPVYSSQCQQHVNHHHNQRQTTKPSLHNSPPHHHHSPHINPSPTDSPTSHSSPLLPQPPSYAKTLQQQQQNHNSTVQQQQQQLSSPLSPPVPQVKITDCDDFSSEVSMTQYRNNGVSDNCQSPTSPHSASSYSPVQSPSLPPTTQVHSTFSDTYLVQQQQQQQTNALQHQFEQFNMQNPPHAVSSTTMGSMAFTTNGLCGSSSNNGIYSLAFSQQQPDTALQLSQAAMLSLSSPDDVLQPHFLGPVDVMASGNSNRYSQSSSSPTMSRHAGNHQQHQQQQQQQQNNNSLSSSPSSSKIPDIVLTGVDDIYRSPLDFAKDIGNAITGLADYFDADLLENEEAFKADLYPLDPEDIQMMTNASLVADPATEDTFKLDRL